MADWHGLNTGYTKISKDLIFVQLFIVYEKFQCIAHQLITRYNQEAAE